MFGKALGLFDHHFRNCDVARSGFVERGGDDFALHAALHVGDFFRTFVDQQDDQKHFRMVCFDRLGDVLHDDGLTRPRLRDDERALAFSDRRDDVDNAAGLVFDGRIFELHLQALGRIERRQIVEVDFVSDTLGIFKIDRVDLGQSEIAFAVFRRFDLAFDSVASAQTELPDLLWANVDVVRAGQVVRLRRTQKAKAV